MESILCSHVNRHVTIRGKSGPANNNDNETVTPGFRPQSFISMV